MPRDVYELPADLEHLLTMPVYPGMIPDETRPLREFLRRHHLPFREIQFNARLGAGDAVPVNTDAALRKAWENLTKLRIDAIAMTHGDEATLIEVKVLVANAAVWQLLAYRDAYAADNPATPIRLMLVGESATPAARMLSGQAGIALYLYEFPPGSVDISAPVVTEATNEV
jgi:hypothetical protein